MAITDYASLKAAVGDWLVGQSVTEQVDTFLDLAEAELSRKLRLKEMVTRAVATVTSQYTGQPSDMLELRQATVTWSGTDYTLRQITMDSADYNRVHLMGGIPQFFVVSGAEFEIVPAPSGEATVEIVYYGAIPALSDDAPTNWLLRKAPDLYLNCALAHAQPYLANPQFAAFHRAETDRIVEEMRLADTNAQLGASPLISRTRRTF